MLVFRATADVLKSLPRSSGPEPRSDTVLGDWMVRRVVVDRRSVLVLVSERGFLPALVPAHDVKGLPSRLADVVGDRLRRLGIPERDVEAEVARMREVFVAKTRDRRLTGLAVDYGRGAEAHLRPGWSDEDLIGTEALLQTNPCLATTRDVVVPQHAVPLLFARARA